MKKLILFAFVSLIAPASFAQSELASETLSSVNGIKLDGKFSFTFNQNEYYVQLSLDNQSYEELDSQGTVIGHGAYNHADINTVIPEVSSPAGIMSNTIQFTVVSKTETSVIIEVTDGSGDSGVFELHKI